MKNKIWIVGLLLGLSFLAKAEYNGWYIKFKMVTQANDTIIGYTYVAQVYFEVDSIKNPKYLIDRFDVLDHNQRDTIHFHHHLITYRYKSPGGDDEKIYTMINLDSIPNNEVKTISVVEMYEYGYLQGVASNHEITDTLWMKTPVVDTIRTGGNLCSWDIFIHEKDKTTEKLKADIKAIESRYKPKIFEIEEELDYPEGDHELLEDQLEELIEKKEDQLNEIIKNYKGGKVVIISFCSC